MLIQTLPRNHTYWMQYSNGSNLNLFDHENHTCKDDCNSILQEDHVYSLFTRKGLHINDNTKTEVDSNSIHMESVHENHTYCSKQKKISPSENHRIVFCWTIVTMKEMKSFQLLLMKQG